MCSAALENRTKSERLFFALWPNDALRQQIKTRSKSILPHTAGRAVPIGNLHITLAFLGNVDVEQRRCIERMAGDVPCPRFDLQLNQFGYWSQSRVLWVAPTAMPEALTNLAVHLFDGAEGCGLKLDVRPYRAHVTLMRKLMHGQRDTDCQPLNWPVDRFVLVRSTMLPEGVKYEVVGEWGLGAE